MRASLAIFAAMIAVGCATTSTVDSSPEIERVELAGVPADLDVSPLIEALANHEPTGWIVTDRARLDELALEVDRRRVESFFREQGYFAVEVEDPTITRLEVDEVERVVLRFEVRPGPPSTVRRIELEGAPEGTGELRALLELKEGEPFRYPAYVRGKERVREHLFNAGYAHVIVTGRVQVARQSAEVAVVYLVDSGPKVKFGRIKVEGRTEVPEESIRARVAFAPGDPFDPRRLSLTEKREYELTSVGTVRFDLDDQTRGEIADVAVNVTDATPNELRLGAGVGLTTTRYEANLRANYLRRRFFHPLYSFRGEVRPAISYVRIRGEPEPNISASAEIQRDDLLIPRLTLVLGASFELTQYELFRTLGPSTYVGLDRPLFDDHLRASLRLELTYQDLHTEVAMAERAGIGFFETLRVASVTPALIWDDRDDVLSPKSGTYFQLELAFGRSLVEGGGSFAKVTPDARAYLPLWTEQLILAARVRAGFAFAGDARVPATHRYFGGGSESQRGFGRRFLSPDIVAGGVRGPVGGEALLEGSIELRFDAFMLFGNWLGFVAFLDAGDVTARPSDLRPLRLHLAAGPGLRYRTPIGPLRFDFGFRLNRTGTGEPEPDNTWGTFHFSLGEAF